MMQYSTKDHDDGHSAELVMALKLECLEVLVVCLEDLQLHFALELDDLPLMQILTAPHNHIHKEFYYHTNKTYRRRKICQKKEK